MAAPNSQLRSELNQTSHFGGVPANQGGRNQMQQQHDSRQNAGNKRVKRPNLMLQLTDEEDRGMPSSHAMSDYHGAGAAQADPGMLEDEDPSGFGGGNHYEESKIMQRHQPPVHMGPTIGLP